MKEITLQQLEYFHAVMRCASFSQAAQTCFTTQSNISKSIKCLEDAVGEQLFYRQNRGVLPTQKAILLDLELTESAHKIYRLFDIESKQKDRKQLNIAFCQSIFFPSVFPEFFSLFREKEYMQSFETSFHCEEVNNVIQDVAKGTADLGFILSDSKVSNPQIKMRLLIEDNPKIYYSKNCPLYKNPAPSPADFAEYPILTTKYLIEQNDYRMINSLPFMPNSIKIVDSYDDLQLYLATGSYITILRPYVTLAFNNSIVSYTLSNYDVSQGISAIWLSSNNNQGLNYILDHIKLLHKKLQ